MEGSLYSPAGFLLAPLPWARRLELSRFELSLPGDILAIPSTDAGARLHATPHWGIL
jgi:hypothetical protein